MGRLARWFARLFGKGESRQQQQELIELARQAHIYPDNERLILRLADCHLRGGDKERALSGYWHVADIYKKRSDWQKAAAVLKRIVVLQPAELIARFELAQCFERMERKREAAQEWVQAGWMMKSSKDIEGAVRAFTRVLELDPAQHAIGAELARMRPTPPPVIAPPTPPKVVAVPKLVPLPKAETKPKAEPPPTPVRPNLASLGRAAVREEVARETFLDNPLDGWDLGVDGKATVEYSAEDLGTLLEDDFDADTIAAESLPQFDDDHRPSDTPSDPAIIR